MHRRQIFKGAAMAGVVIFTTLVLIVVKLQAEDVSPSKIRVDTSPQVQATPDQIVPSGHEHMLPHYGILDIGGATFSTTAPKVFIWVHPVLYVDGKPEEQFGAYPVLLERGNDVQLSASLKNFGVEWDDRLGNEGPLHYVATGNDPKRGRTHFAKGKFEWPKEKGYRGNIIRREEIPLPESVPMPYGERVAIWAFVGEGVRSIDQLSTPTTERGMPLERAQNADWAFVLFVTAKEANEE